jgi:Fe-S-cluster containining protein
VQAGARVDPSWPACERFEEKLDCQRCAACCREAYEVVELSRRDPFVRAHPELIEKIDERLVLLRRDGRCPALSGDGPYACRCYDDRPRTCREFERGSANCLDARRRVGLSL